jgi:diaminopimelate decarboxylase
VERARISLRVNPDVDAKTHPYISTGTEGQQVRHRARARRGGLLACRRLPGIEVVGIDCHIGSQITEIGPYLDALDRVLDLVEAIEAQGIRLHHLDLGGGLGITYTDESRRQPRPDAARCSSASTHAAMAIAS